MGQHSFLLLLFWHFHIRKGEGVIIFIGRPLFVWVAHHRVTYVNSIPYH
ncbi:hypothetical protein GLYMA_13G159676v4 [Glycine max]|nr:hypothetical protein GLYMA_13G159676v4 [Glycine max]KAH1101784.1 hypothetical protein GYH30_036387 [Glycine max]